jgi:hypothetical protein
MALLVRRGPISRNSELAPAFLTRARPGRHVSS